MMDDDVSCQTYLTCLTFMVSVVLYIGLRVQTRSYLSFIKVAGRLGATPPPWGTELSTSPSITKLDDYNIDYFL